MNIFKDQQGRIIIGQWPNRYLWLTLAFYVVQFIPIYKANSLSFWGVTLSLLYWSYLEIISGVNSWRRLLGVLVALSQCLKLFKYVSPTW